MVKSKKFIFAKRFEGMPKVSDFRLEEETLPELKNNEILVQAIWHSVDPYMRYFCDQLPPGITMVGAQVAKVIESKNSDYPIDTLVVGTFGWQTHTIYNPASSVNGFSARMPPYKAPAFDGLPASLGVGHLGMPGNSAYFGFLDICKPKAGETVVVSGAAGAVGSLVGQLAKMKGCTVIGIAGTDAKCAWLKKEVGYDHTINYKTDSIGETLKKYAPNGVDCYFDNVGGEMSSTIINQMNDFGRISVCGSISAYNLTSSEYPRVPLLQPAITFKQLKMEGFLATRYWDRWQEGIAEMKKWTLEGKLKYHETIYEGFEKMPEAFIDMLKGGNIGKAVVKS